MADRLRLPDSIARVLVVAGPAHGDVLLATPLLKSLRRAYSNAVIDVLVYRGQSGVLAGNPDIDEVLAASKHPGFREYARLLRRLLRRYDLAISTKHTDRAIWYAFLSGKSRIAVVPADKDAWKRWLMHASIPYDHYNTHTVTQNNSLAELLDIDVCHDIRLPTAEDSKNVIAGLLPAEVRGKPFAVLHLNPGVPYKRWTISGWTAVAEYFDGQDMPMVLTGDGSPNENDYMQTVTRQMPASVVNLAGKLRFADVTELLSQCAIYVGTDTVTSHMAAAAGIPAVVLFGPESPRVWGPWPRGYTNESPFPSSGDQRTGNVLVLQSSVPCTTCRQGDCLRRSEKGRSCTLMQTLDGEHVTGELNRLLRLTMSNIEPSTDEQNVS